MAYNFEIIPRYPKDNIYEIGFDIYTGEIVRGYPKVGTTRSYTLFFSGSNGKLMGKFVTLNYVESARKSDIILILDFYEQSPALNVILKLFKNEFSIFIKNKAILDEINSDLDELENSSNDLEGYDEYVFDPETETNNYIIEIYETLQNLFPESKNFLKYIEVRFTSIDEVKKYFVAQKFLKYILSINITNQDEKQLQKEIADYLDVLIKNN